MESKNPLALLTVRFPLELMEKLREVAAREDRTVGAEIRHRVAMSLERRDEARA